MPPPPRKHRLSPEERQALELLASDPQGATEELLVLAHGLDSDMIAGLVHSGLAMARRAAERLRSSASGSRARSATPLLPKIDGLTQCADALCNATPGTTFKTCTTSRTALRAICRLTTRCADGRGQCCEDNGRRRARVGLNALGPCTMVVEKAPEAIAGQLQRASGDRCRQADVP